MIAVMRVFYRHTIRSRNFRVKSWINIVRRAMRPAQMKGGN